MADIQDFVQDGEPQLFPVPMPSSNPDWLQILVSINSLLYTIVNEFSNKKKKSGVKKEERKINKKETLYLKKKDGTLEINPIIEPTLTAEERFFQNELIKKYPNICNMDEPLTLAQYNNLVMRFTRPNVIDMLGHFDNHKRIVNYVSAYKALHNWLMIEERKAAQRR